MRLKSVFVLLSCAVTAFATVAVLSFAQSHHAALVLSHYFKKNTGTCTLAESFQGEALSRLQFSNVNEIRAASKILRTDGPYTLWDTPAGQYWAPSASRDGLIYDLAEQKRSIYGTNIRRGDIVLDAGANVGVFTRKALWAGAAKVIAIEPAPENLECLRRNFAAEIAQGRVVIYPKGVWDKDDVLRLSIDPESSARDSFIRPIENARYLEAPLTTIDELVKELRLPRVDFIKMDIEGAERKAIVGAKQTIARFRPRMALCIYHVDGDDRIVPKLVTAIVPAYRKSETCFCAEDRVQPEVAFFN